MIIYDLRCEQEHQFEGWFRSVDDYQVQKKSGLLSCPVCDSNQVTKIPSASYVQTGKRALTQTKESENNAPATASIQPPTEIQLRQTLETMQEFIRKHSEDVGTNFAEEAKKIHYGEVKKRNIHGQASGEELQQLNEEGISVLALPIMSADKKKLN